ncbi:hypothetical protein [Paenibacillus sp. 453mf]|uniref:hypothetical protein n=1 Tax=Paenibacillus sp. 453mf TaxID=1761874 RepID=UPI0008EE8D0B|nr:hypothetical protein [Paenibacillus sp. 453mf]SFS76100.1 hypothetical protein SAMN04488601_10336 [Paenibacillus sp. 453mf]
MKKFLSFRSVEKIAFITVIVSVSICFVCIAVAYLLALEPLIVINEWDFLAFLGSIVGGVLTLVGVNMTIREQRNERLAAKYEDSVKQLMRVNKELTFIINARNMVVTNSNTNEKDILNTMRLRAGTLNNFIEIINKNMSEIMTSLNLTTYRVFEIKFNFLSSNFALYYKNIDYHLNPTNNSLGKFEKKLNEFYDKAIDIRTSLDEYEKEILDKYFKIDKKSRH